MNSDESQFKHIYHEKDIIFVINGVCINFQNLNEYVTEVYIYRVVDNE